STANGAQVVQNSSSGAANQKWFIDPWNDGTWRVKNENSSKLLEVPGASVTNNTILDQWDSTSGNNQRWIIDPNGSSGVTFYSSINYGGTPSQVLAKGSYTMSQLAAKGIANDSASSVKIPSGWTVTIYQSDNFAGSSWTRTSDTADFTTISGLNDTMSSCVIQ
ncbi:MAG TPA: RICIN domain-containing protein, partial [Desulfuromonadaceae bacterium]|nr:RICIN domain-containing protein [Desulfuromonadaceae bacterium]